MSLVMPTHAFAYHPFKQRRRTATDVLAGNFDLRPPRDVLTSLLNGVGPYKEVEKDEEMRRSRRREKEKEKDRERREREREKKRAALATADERPSADPPSTSHLPPPASAQAISAQSAQPSSFWRARGSSQRPTINIATNQRSVSVTPPPMASSPRSTPGPSSSSVTSRTSSKRPRTPCDDGPIDEAIVATSPPSHPPPRKRRVAVRKGWKGWVEGSPPPSEKLINLDIVPVLHERRTRSGKSFDAIGVGKETWV
ncbi:hypothetical protein BKA82DRAFT_18461 [Pisolithus tinctorius]|uniref:Uncharacterized protein n=1 Tax=Pisolithus tinctorius Marx 270 TaxID=870435 RepID=A0A0C3PXQ6_PISTI|nr:hypothetical protein BKA82DRAFT_18461 [Pisolithus tinctorius]KIO14266.1 hypothetical protein M404DRAFT_18461 [Pisolithus tinctorius Marx 270]